MHSLRIAWIALVATLFSAASPTLAAVFFVDDPAALRQMLGMAPATRADADECVSHTDQHAQTTDSSTGHTHDDPAHATHGVFCSFCLNPSSVATFLAAPLSVSVLNLQFASIGTQLNAGLVIRFIPHYLCRAPPGAS
ncbi:MAG: DUF2946 family protein [Pseudomonadota bacterium]